MLFSLPLPVGRADVVPIGRCCVRLRAALDYHAIRGAYGSAAELQRLGRCSVAVMDETLTGLAALIEVRGSIIEITAGIQGGCWVYVDASTGMAVIGSAGLPAGVPSLLSDTAKMSVQIDDLRLQLSELGCASIGLPPISLELNHKPLVATSQDAQDLELGPQDGHEWQWRILDVGSPGRLVEIMIRPFIDLTSYRAALSREVEFCMFVKPGHTEVGVTASVPIPSRMSLVLTHFMKWWCLRQIANFDELRLLGDTCQAVAEDLANLAEVSDFEDWCSCAGTFYHDAMSWLSEYELGLESRPSTCCGRRWWRRLCSPCPMRRRPSARRWFASLDDPLIAPQGI